MFVYRLSRRSCLLAETIEDVLWRRWLCGSIAAAEGGAAFYRAPLKNCFSPNKKSGGHQACASTFVSLLGIREGDIGDVSVFALCGVVLSRHLEEGGGRGLWWRFSSATPAPAPCSATSDNLAPLRAWHLHISQHRRYLFSASRLNALVRAAIRVCSISVHLLLLHVYLLVRRRGLRWLLWRRAAKRQRCLRREGKRGGNVGVATAWAFR